MVQNMPDARVGARRASSLSADRRDPRGQPDDDEANRPAEQKAPEVGRRRPLNFPVAARKELSLLKRLVPRERLFQKRR
ncbi:MAG: hypothetical protein KDA41_04410, partial [Planctomycetales bacterium]|nr:hypothetical protein [Planctomycetales bacterium]